VSIAGWTLVFVVSSFALYSAIAVASRVRTTSGFYVAGRGVSAVANGMATGADWMSAASFISMAGLISFMGYDGAIYLMGWTGGYVLLALLVAPYLRRYGRYTIPEFVGDRAALPEQRTGAEGHRAERRFEAGNPELVPGSRHLPGAGREALGPLGDLPDFKVLARGRNRHEHKVEEEWVPLVEGEGEPHIPIGEFVGRARNGIRHRRRRRVAGCPGEEHRRKQRRETGTGGGTADSGSVCGERWRCRREGRRSEGAPAR